MKIKFIYVAIISLLIPIFSFGQNDWAILKLNENVKSIEIINYNVVEHFGEVKKTDIIDGENYTFNKNGFIIHKKNYGVGGKPINQFSFTYDDYNNIIEQNISDKDGKLVQRTTIEYNKLRKRTYESIYQFDGRLIGRLAYTYVNRIQLKSILTFDSNGQKKDLQEFSYNKKKLTKLVTTINPKSKIKGSSKKYDHYDNMIESSIFDVVGNLKTSISFKYDDDRNLIESSFFDKEELVTKRNLMYNNLGFLVEENVEYPKLDKKDKITYSYDFDKKVNWIKKIKYINSIPVKIVERTITYY